MSDALDHEALRRYLQQRVAPDWDGLTIERLERTTGGLSWDIFVIHAVEHGPRQRSARWVIRCAPRIGPLSYDVEREALLQQALARAGVPVPDVLAFETDDHLLGAPFTLMNFVDGDIPALRTIETWPRWGDEHGRAEVAAEVMHVLAAIQRFDWQAAGLGTVLGRGSARDRVTDSVTRLVSRIERDVADRWVPSPTCREAGQWLIEHVPDAADDELVVVHGDFRIGNFVWRGDRIAAVLDWERAQLGDRMQDLGFMCMPMARQRRPELMGMLLTEDDLATQYAAATGRALDRQRLHYYVIYWQFVELAQITRAIPFMLEVAGSAGGSLTSYQLLSMGAVQLLDAIEQHESGSYRLGPTSEVAAS